MRTENARNHRGLDVFKVTLSTTLFAVILVATMLGCATTGTSMPSATQLSAAGLVETNVDHGALERGRAIAITACAECHRQYFPQEYSPEVWPKWVKKMGKLSSLSEKQMEDLNLYMVTASQMPEAIVLPEVEKEENTSTE